MKINELSSEGDGDPVKSVLFYNKSKGSNDSKDSICQSSEITKKVYNIMCMHVST